jgi:predicted enzyme related to lactoylglutathione lyase
MRSTWLLGKVCRNGGDVCKAPIDFPSQTVRAHALGNRNIKTTIMEI